MRGALARFFALPRLARVLWILASLLALDLLLRLS
jgi:hypothetical protein